MQRETISFGLRGASITCQYYGDKGGWLVKYHWIEHIEEYKLEKLCLCKNMDCIP
jgi:hypothetical protein